MGFRVEYPPVYKPGMPCTKCSDDAPFCDNGLCGKYIYFFYQIIIFPVRIFIGVYGNDFNKYTKNQRQWIEIKIYSLICTAILRPSFMIIEKRNN